MGFLGGPKVSDVYVEEVCMPANLPKIWFLFVDHRHPDEFKALF